MELDKIIEYIVQEVVKKINSQNIIEEFSPKEKILVAITGSTNNLEQIVLELRKISKNYDLSLVFSEAAKNIIDENVFSEFHTIKDFSIKNYDELPVECREYIEFIEKELEVPIKMISNGPKREDIIYKNSSL